MGRREGAPSSRSPLRMSLSRADVPWPGISSSSMPCPPSFRRRACILPRGDIVSRIRPLALRWASVLSDTSFPGSDHLTGTASPASRCSRHRRPWLGGEPPHRYPPARKRVMSSSPLLTSPRHQHTCTQHQKGAMAPSPHHPRRSAAPRQGGSWRRVALAPCQCQPSSLRTRVLLVRRPPQLGSRSPSSPCPSCCGSCSSASWRAASTPRRRRCPPPAPHPSPAWWASQSAAPPASPASWLSSRCCPCR